LPVIGTGLGGGVVPALEGSAGIGVAVGVAVVACSACTHVFLNSPRIAAIPKDTAAAITSTRLHVFAPEPGGGSDRTITGSVTVGRSSVFSGSSVWRSASTLAGATVASAWLSSALRFSASDAKSRPIIVATDPVSGRGQDDA
jgi:hypothetical protein